MSQNQKNHKYLKVLDELQLQSWQLELLISGFAIFGLFSVLEPSKQLFSEYFGNDSEIIGSFFFFIYLANMALLCNLIIHVFLRGIWIGAIRLRSVSGEIDFDKLNFSTYFTHKIKNKIGSFDDYINRLEKYSSVLFALSFLMLFYIIGLFVAIYTPLIIISILFNFDIWEWTHTLILIIISLYYLGLFIVFIDFISQGFLKKNQRISKFYYHLYIFYGWFTLAKLYRHLLYNFQDNKFGRNLVKFLIPFYIILFFVSTLTEKTTFIDAIPNLQSSSSVALKMNYYDKTDTNKRIGLAQLDSKIITTNYLKLKIPWGLHLEAALSEYDSINYPNTAKSLTSSLLNLEFFPEQSTLDKYTVDINHKLTGLNKLIAVSIDNVDQTSDFIFSEENEGNFVLLSVFSLKNFADGKHIVKIKLRNSKKDASRLEHFEAIPFYYYKD